MGLIVFVDSTLKFKRGSFGGGYKLHPNQFQVSVQFKCYSLRQANAKMEKGRKSFIERIGGTWKYLSRRNRRNRRNMEEYAERRVVYDHSRNDKFLTLEEEAEQFDIEVEAAVLSSRITVRRPTTYIGDIVKEFCSQVILSKVL